MMVSPAVIRSLQAVLKKGRDVDRCLAVQAVGRLGLCELVGDIVGRLHDEDEDVRVDAVEALGGLGDRSACAVLREALIESPSGDIKVNAIRALAALGDRSSVALLKRLARDRDDAVAWDDEAALVGGWDDWLDVQVEAIEALGRLGDVTAVAEIVEAIDDEMGQALTEPGFRALARLGEPGADALARYLSSSDLRMRKQSAHALGQSGSVRATEALVDALADPNPEMRMAAAQALAMTDRSHPALAGLLGDADADVRSCVIALCGDLHPERLDALLEDPTYEVQVAAMRALIRRGPDAPAAADARIRAKTLGPSVEVAVAAAEALVALWPKAATPDLVRQLADRRNPVDVRRAAARGLANVGGEEAVTALAEARLDDDRPVRLEVFAALARIAAAMGDATVARQALLDALQPAPDETEGEPGPASETGAAVAEGAAADPEPAAANAIPTSTLGAILDARPPAPVADDESPEPLGDEEAALLSNANRLPAKRVMPLEPDIAASDDARLLAARVLGDVPGPDIIDALARTLSDPDAIVRRAALDSIARQQVEAPPPTHVVDAIKPLLRDGDAEICAAAIRAAGRLRAVDLCDELRRLALGSEPGPRAEAARALALLGGLEPLAQGLLSDSDPAVRLAAAEAVAGQGGPASIERLVEFGFSHDGMHRRQAARLLRQVEAGAAAEHATRVLSDQSRQREWPIAIEIIEELYRTETDQGGGPAVSARAVA